MESPFDTLSKGRGRGLRSPPPPPKLNQLLDLRRLCGFSLQASDLDRFLDQAGIGRCISRLDGVFVRINAVQIKRLRRGGSVIHPDRLRRAVDEQVNVAQIQSDRAILEQGGVLERDNVLHI